MVLIIKLAPPKFPSHVSKSLKEFLNCCLQKDPLRRLPAKKLIEHEFFKMIDYNKLEENSEKQIKDFSNENMKFSLNMYSSVNKDIKLQNNYTPKFKHIHIKDSENMEKESKDNNFVNIFAKEEKSAGLFSMSITQNSIGTQIFDKLNENENINFKILPNTILEESLCENNQTKNENIKQNSVEFLEFQEISNKNIKSINTNDKLDTLKMNNDDFEKLEFYFKKNCVIESLPKVGDTHDFIKL